MRYVLTQHATVALQERRIEVAWLERTLLAPELVKADHDDPGVEHRLRRIVEYDNRVLRVVLRKQEILEIITVYFDRNMRGKL